MAYATDELAPRRERRQLRALVADDDLGMRRLLAAVLELDGWDVQCASDGEEALALAAEYRPDAVLLDVMMPNSDGLTALRRLRETDGGRECAVMIVSGLGEPETQQQAIDAGCDDYLVKPVAVDEVSARVLRLVQRIGIAD
jgi:two-component system, OmpR family, response regulator